MCKIGIRLGIIALILMGFSALVPQDAWARVHSTSVCAWGERDWSDMTRAQRALWSRLGWNQARWDADREPASEAKDWNELSAGERAAATQLGFNAGNWGANCSSGTGLNSPSPSERSKAAVDNITE